MWDGLFQPYDIRKRIEDVRFVPIVDMDYEAWRTLDYRNLRPTAKNRIAEAIAENDLVGFFVVDVTEKARTKPRYLWPTRRRMRRQYEEDQGGGGGSPHDFFKNEADEAFQSNIADTIDDLIARLIRDRNWFRNTLVRAVATKMSAYVVDRLHITEEEFKRAIEKLRDGEITLDDADAALEVIVYLSQEGYSLEEMEEFFNELDPDYEFS